MTPFDLRPGVRVRMVRVPECVDQPNRREALVAVLGRLGTVEGVTDNKTAWIRWDEGGEGFWTAECLELET